MAWVFRDDLKYSPAGSAKFRWNNNNTEIRYSWLASFDKNAPEKWLILISHAICLTNARETWKTLEKRKKKKKNEQYPSSKFIIRRHLLLLFVVSLFRNLLFYLKHILLAINSTFPLQNSFEDIIRFLNLSGYIRFAAKRCYSYYNDTRKYFILR